MDNPLHFVLYKYVNNWYLGVGLHSWWCPSVNSFKFQLCNHTPPGTQRLWFPGSCSAGHGNNAAGSPVGIVYGRNYDGI